MTIWKYVLAVLVALSGRTAHAQSDMVRPESLPQGFVLVVKDETGKADSSNPIYLASSINGWNPSDEKMVLSGRSDTRWQIVLDRNLNGVGMQFKFTLGGWDQEELDGSGNAIENRSLPLIDRSALEPGELPIIELSIVQFRIPVSLADEVRRSGNYRHLEVTGDVRRIEVRGGAGGAEQMTRDLLVWLPPNYDAPENADRHYPVLYMCDGQNLFEQMPGVPGEWHADETATALIEAGKIEPLIIVGIPSAGALRVREYLPFDAIEGIDHDGAAFVQWVVNEVKPRVDRALRTKADAKHTSIGGASLGGTIALYASTAHANVFGAAIIESLPMLNNNGDETRAYLKGIYRWPNRVFIGMGGREVSADETDSDRNRMYRQWANEVDMVFKDAGLGEDRRMLVIEPMAHHNELAWSDRFGRALKFLYPLHEDQ
ncbi:MAG: hypothetical protein JKY96_09150 [Phycisphaerales bacterium]|nr:hypothetical protein [Phycisphaerales bacterium]